MEKKRTQKLELCSTDCKTSAPNFEKASREHLLCALLLQSVDLWKALIIYIKISFCNIFIATLAFVYLNRGPVVTVLWTLGKPTLFSS